MGVPIIYIDIVEKAPLDSMIIRGMLTLLILSVQSLINVFFFYEHTSSRKENLQDTKQIPILKI